MKRNFFWTMAENFDLFLKTAFHVSKGTFWVKNFFWNFCFFSNFSELWTNSYCAWRESFWQGYQKWKMHFSSHKINQKIKLLKVLFFFNFFRILNEQLPCLAKKFSAGISKLKIAVFVSKYQSKNQFFENSLFCQLLQNFERTITVLGKKVFGRDIKIENCSLRLVRSNKKSNIWKISLFLKDFQHSERTFTVLGEKVLGRGIKIENCSLRLKR